MVQLEAKGEGFELRTAGRTILRHCVTNPCISVASGNPQVTMVRGNFRLSDDSVAAAPLTRCNLESERESASEVVLASADGGAQVAVRLAGARLTLAALSGHDRVIIDLALADDDILWGGGRPDDITVIVSSIVDTSVSAAPPTFASFTGPGPAPKWADEPEPEPAGAANVNVPVFEEWA